MSGSLPWSSAPPPPASFDPNDVLRRIEQNTAVTAQWIKYLTFAVVLLIVLTALLFV
jgi:hypothetical protein